MRLQSIAIPLVIFSLPQTVYSAPDPSCPKTLADLEATPQSQESPFTERFTAYATALSATPWFTTFAKGFYRHVTYLFEILLDTEREQGGWNIPYPEDSVYNLYNFITDRKLQCYARKSPEQLLLSMVTITASSAYGGMSDFGGSESSEVGDQTADTLAAETENIEPNTYFQYIDTGVLQALAAIVDSYVFQLNQMKHFAVNKYSRHEMSLLNAALDWWELSGKSSLDRTVKLVQLAEGYLREPGAFDEEKAAYWLDKDALPWVETEEVEPLGLWGLLHQKNPL
ncbi:hypothetical protein H072_10180 [Dactylellina haptotyla CBS 200.50]|uniref:Uncharacterized protein n=1 Tax=Dactylellina haptotyla (strain CBS 200.50) TaxID=1284197 RepID=S8A5B5_DACHA|nr:hypothetical protein H072_10180 [Dactylellina haptotyla CBS 200.50]